jgi:cyclomaltodextrinase / maltogenic alpha-amylase / neopullulanase
MQKLAANPPKPKASAVLARTSAIAFAIALALTIPRHAAADEFKQGQPGAAISGLATCEPQPFESRPLYLRGSFNSWTASEPQKFTYACNRYELVTRLEGEHSFKIADEAWSKDTDFGGGALSAGKPHAAMLNGPAFSYRFNGTHRIVLAMTDPAPTLSLSSCDSPPLADTTLFLRGTMNNWATQEDYAFQFSCDAYYLNVRLSGQQEFKIADASWQAAKTFGGSGATATAEPNQAMPVADGKNVGNLAFHFNGEHTLRLAFAGGKPLLTIGPKSFADPTVAAVKDSVALSLRHDSRVLEDKAPFGAVPVGTTVTFGVSAMPGVSELVLVLEKRRLEGNQDLLDYAEVARVPMRKALQDERERWSALHTFADASVYGYHFEATIGNKTYVLQNNRDSIYWTREKGSNGISAVDEKPASRQSLRRFRHTVYAADFKVPDWAQDVVYYYIFPERFRNGNRANDPKPERDTYQDKSVEFHKNWLDKPYKPNSGDGSDAVYNNDFFGGDLAGIIEKLDYIADLGANTIYMTPVFKASSNHKYDTADYKAIDPAFGTDADFTRLTSEAAQRGIRVIPDTSLNHVGADSIYFDRFGKYASEGAFEKAQIRAQSPYADWFSFDTAQSDPDKQFKGWVGINDLPELNKASTDFRNFAYGAPDSVMKRWLDRGAAGWRMDVAPWVPDDFWREWRTAIKRHKPDALTIAETWFDSSKYFLGDTFDSTMNYIFRSAVLDYAGGGRAAACVQQLEYLREVYPQQAFYALMNLLSTHDAARALHVFGNKDEATEGATVDLAKRRLRLAVFFQMIYPGAPAVYYGDEVGVTGGEDPFNRATYPWADQGGKPDTALLGDFKTLIKMRKDNAVLRRGSIGAPLHVDDHVIVLARQLGNVWAITATNNSDRDRVVTVKLPAAVSVAAFEEALTRQRISTSNDGSLTMSVPALYGAVLISR